MKIIYLIIATILLVSCEKTIDVDLPYKKQVVILSKINLSSQIDEFQVTYTLPPLQEREDTWNSEAPRLPDEDVKIFVNGNETIVRWDSNHENYRFDKINLKVGDRLRIEATFEGKFAFAESFIPEAPEILDLYYEVSSKRNPWFGGEYVHSVNIYAKVKPLPGLVYMAGNVQSFGFYPKTYMNQVFQYENAADDGTLTMKIDYTREFYSSSPNFEIDETMYDESTFFVEAIDKEYYNYYITNERNLYDDSFFGFSGLNIEGNIKGDGFGIFVGSNTTERKLKE